MCFPFHPHGGGEQQALKEDNGIRFKRRHGSVPGKYSVLPSTLLRKGMNRESGFTLIELIASMVIFGLLFTLAGMGIVMAAKGYVITKESAHLAQQAQLAMARINREFREITAIAAKVDTAPDPYIIYDHIEGRKAIAKGSDTIKMFFNLGSTQTTLPAFSEGDTLLDEVTTFTLVYNKKDQTAWVFGIDDIADLSSIDVEIAINRPDSDIGEKTFSMTVRPRNTRN